MYKRSAVLNKVLNIIVSSLLVFQSFAPGLLYAQEVSSTTAVEPTPSPSVELTPSPESTPTLEPSPSVEPTISPEPSPSASVLPEVSPEISPSPTPSAEPLSEDQVENNSSPEPTMGQPNAPPVESPTPQTPEPSPSVSVEQPAEGHISATILENTDAESLQLDLSTQPDVSSASLSTDKADYAPTDTAVITGVDFPKEAELKLIITADNYRFEAEVKTDENGTFAYFYQLDGTYRPLYNVEAQDLSGQILATTSFTDAPQSGCTTDSAGANDEPGQKDLTKMCADYNDLPTSVDVLWNWDENSWSGQNTGDGCSLFDTDGDGLINYSLCVTVGGNPAAIQSTTLYSCGDGKPDRCTNPIVVLPQSQDTSCSASVQPTDPFPAGDGYPNDTQASCNIALNDVGGVSVAALVDVCSYPSQQPNSDPSDCILLRDRTGKLEVIKDLVPDNDTGLFNLQIDGQTEAANVGDGGSTGEKIVSAGTSNSVNHTVGETAGTNTSLGDYTSSIVCKDLNGTGSIVAQSNSSGHLTVPVLDEQDIVCTITNTKMTGSVKVHKFVDTNGDGIFDQTSDSNANTLGFRWGLDGVSPTTDFGTEVSGVSAGTHNVNENSVPDYQFVSWFINGGQGSCTNPDGTSLPASITVNSNNRTEITLCNARETGTLIVKKILINDSGGTLQEDDFSFSVNGTSAVSFESDGQNDLTVNAGTYTVTEPSVDDYDTSYDNCSDIVITNGDTQVCTITNDDIAPTLTLIKHLPNDNGGTANQNDFTVYIDDEEVDWGANIVDAGDLTVSEDTLPGYEPSVWGGDCDEDGNITLLPGDNKICEITNDDTPGTLIVRKVVVNESGGEKTAADFSFSVNDGEAVSFEEDGQNDLTVNAGTYNVTEPEVAGYATSYDNCSDVVIPNGGSATCTITNDDAAALLVVKKHVINDNGGTLEDINFNMSVTGNQPDPAFFPGSESGTIVILGAGSYSVDEEEVSGYLKTLGVDCSGTIGNGESKTCTITNDDEAGSISGIKWNDEDGNGEQDCEDDSQESCELGLEGWTIFLDENGDGLFDEGEDFEETDEDGFYSLADLNAGTYRVCEEPQNGWSQTFPDNLEFNNCHEAIVSLGEDVRDIDFGNRGQVTITVHKNVDNDGDEEVDEENVTDWTWDIDGQGDFETGDTAQTVAAGTYTVSEDQQDGFHATAVECNDGQVYNASERIEVSVEPGQDLVCTFTNTRNNGSITIIKNIDANGDGDSLDEGDVRNAQGWTYDITDGDQNNPMGGSKTLAPGTYTISEDQKAGHQFFDWSCSNEQTGTTNSIEINVTNGSDTTCTFTNQSLPPVLSLTKTNDKTGIDVSAGANVLYSLTVTLTGSSLSNVSLIDLPPAGFKYRLGSWTAVSSLRGDLKPEVTTEPTYASPGLWSLGSMVSGEVVTLTYIADIDGSTDPGLYKDLAWSKGTGAASSTVLANESSGFFIGTEVNVVKDQGASTGVNVERIEEKEGEVLGVSTSLPATGANAVWLIMATFLLVGGCGLVWKGMTLRKKYE